MPPAQKIPPQPAPTKQDLPADPLPSAGGGTTRRRFLKSGIAGFAGFGLFSSGSPARASGGKRAPSSPATKNIIFMVSDGMSAGVIPLAQEYSRITLSQDSAWTRLLRDKSAACGWMDTASLRSLVTDSAAASSAWGSGSRVLNGSINCLPDGTALVPIGKVFRQHGKKFGLVTTATVTHATPAGFAANAASRQSEEDIAPQYLGEVDVVLGGGSFFFDPKHRPDGGDLFARFSEKGYAVVHSRDELLRAAGAEKILGTFSSSHIPYSIDKATNPILQKRLPSLAEMTRVALGVLSRGGEGFLLQVEAARVDHAAHQNDIATLLQEQLAFDQAISVAEQFLAENPDTLLVITSDHGNSNPGLNGMGESYLDSTAAFAKVALAKESFASFKAWAEGRLTRPEPLFADELAARAASGLGFYPSRGEAETLLGFLQGQTFGDWNMQHANFWGVLAQAAGNHTGVGWTGTTHTADPVHLTAIGAGAAEFSGLVRNDEVFGKLCGLSGIDFRNPRASA